MKLRADGRILAAGTCDKNRTGKRFALASYLSNGDSDLSFGTNGLVTTGFATNTGGFLAARAGDMVIQNDGRIVVGSAVVQTAYGPMGKPALARFMADGRGGDGNGLDPSFGQSGRLISEQTLSGSSFVPWYADAYISARIRFSKPLFRGL